MSLCYESEKWLMISFSSIAISLTVGLVLIQYAHGQINQTETNEDRQFREQLEKQAEEYFKNAFESAVSNATGIPFDLDSNYTQQENYLVALKLFIHICTQPQPTTESQYQCDLGMKQLRDEGLIK